jgi:hypothetical protein
MSPSIDHIVLCVDDLDEAGEELQRRFGLRSLAGGRHAGHGTANRIVPLGSAYLELLAVVDHEEALSSTFGRWVAGKAARGPEPHALCLRTDDLDSICERLGLVPVSMRRVKPDGSELRWRVAGLEDMISRGMPFYIEWDIDPQDHPAHAGTPREALVDATLAGDPDLLARWTAGCEGVSLESGEPGIASVNLRFPDVVYRL